MAASNSRARDFAGRSARTAAPSILSPLLGILPVIVLILVSAGGGGL